MGSVSHISALGKWKCSSALTSKNGCINSSMMNANAICKSFLRNRGAVEGVKVFLTLFIAMHACVLSSLLPYFDYVWFMKHFSLGLYGVRQPLRLHL